MTNNQQPSSSVSRGSPVPKSWVMASVPSKKTVAATKKPKKTIGAKKTTPVVAKAKNSTVAKAKNAAVAKPDNVVVAKPKNATVAKPKNAIVAKSMNTTMALPITARSAIVQNAARSAIVQNAARSAIVQNAARSAGTPAAHHRIMGSNPAIASSQLTLVSNKLFGKAPVLVLVYNDGCMFCNMLKPAWNTATASIVPELNVDVLEVESLAVGVPSRGINPLLDTLLTKYSGSVPYIGLLRTDKSLETYTGDRSHSDLFNFVINNRLR